MSEGKDKIPISDFYKLIDHITIYRSEKWWEAVVLLESFGKRSLGLYLWHKRDGVWKRKHKFNIRDLGEWNRLKNAIVQLLPKLVPSSPQS